jgi:phage-related minor tail protein
LSDEGQETSEPTEMTSELPSPLHSLLTEIHEMYQELQVVGFTKKAATDIVAYILTDSMQYRVSYGEEDDGDFDDEDDGLDLEE